MAVTESEDSLEQTSSDPVFVIFSSCFADVSDGSNPFIILTADMISFRLVFKALAMAL